jgi:Transposase DDE domain
MASLLGAVARVKRDALAALDRTAVERACDELGYDWRDRELDPATTVALFVQQVLHGNVSCGEVRHLPAGKAKRFTASAYCQARSRLPLRVLQTLLTGVVDAALPATRLHEHRWLGRHRVFHVDGSTFSMPDTPELRKAFGTPSGQKPGCGFPVAHLLVLFNAQTGLLVDAWAGPLRTGDVAQMSEAHLHLDAGDVLVGDDSFSGYANLALLASQNLHALLPVHHLRVVDFTKGRPHCGEGTKAVAGMPRSRWVKSLGKEDQLVEYFKPKQPALWMTSAEHDALPDSIVVRELRRTVERPGLGPVTLTMVTTLTDPKAYPADALLELRLRRWDVETDLRHLKTTMGLDVLRCKGEDGVRKELAVFCLVYNLVRIVMLEAARRQQAPVARVSFADALHWMRHARPGDPMPALVLNPLRPNRAEPRCKKRRAKQYDLMNKPRDQLRKALKNAGKRIN